MAIALVKTPSGGVETADIVNIGDDGILDCKALNWYRAFFPHQIERIVDGERLYSDVAYPWIKKHPNYPAIRGKVKVVTVKKPAKTRRFDGKLYTLFDVFGYTYPKDGWAQQRVENVRKTQNVRVVEIAPDWYGKARYAVYSRKK